MSGETEEVTTFDVSDKEPFTYKESDVFNGQQCEGTIHK